MEAVEAISTVFLMRTNVQIPALIRVLLETCVYCLEPKALVWTCYLNGTLTTLRKDACLSITEAVKAMTTDLIPLKTVKNHVLQNFFKQMFVNNLSNLDLVEITLRGKLVSLLSQQTF